MRNYYQLIFLLIIAVTLNQGCRKSENLVTGSNPIITDPKIKTYLGPSVPMVNGTGQAWVAVDSTGNPNAVGINLSETALDGLPAADSTFIFTLPSVGKNFYTHVTVQWNPQGAEFSDAYVISDHYNLPLLAVRFYIVSAAERMKIKSTDSVEFAKGPAVKYIPDHYIQIPGGAAQTGASWVDAASPENSGSVLTKTFVWGTYNGKIIFLGPMISRDYLSAHNSGKINLGQPQLFQKSGWYPQSYQVVYTPSNSSQSAASQFTVALTDLVHKGQ